MILKICLVRHPKKKDSDKKAGPSDDPRKDSPPEATRLPETEESKIKKGLDKVFWLRVSLGILAGTLSAEMGGPLHHIHLVGLGVMILLFIISYGIAKVLRIPLLPSDKRKLLTTGYGSYFLMFVFSWILVNTLTHPDVGILNIR